MNQTNVGQKLFYKDFRLLRLFMEIVKHGGFAQAQAALNLGQSTVSNQMSELEQQLGFRLCHRGRGGFRLTEEGQQVIDAARTLFDSVGSFEARMSSLRDGLVGDLAVHVVDHVSSNPASPLPDAIDLFTQKAPEARLRIYVDTPDNIELSVLNGECDIGIGSFFHHGASLRYDWLFDERQLLVCGARHPLSTRSDTELSPDAISRYPFISRSYLRQQLSDDKEPASFAAHMEAVALMILSGRYLGYLPDHLAEPWIRRGEMVVLLPEDMGYTAPFEFVRRVDGPRSTLVQTFIDCLASVRRQKTTALGVSKLDQNDPGGIAICP
ncbi:HTH-type transcriptional regulator BenM [Antarctobacter heliothermus]|uniref:HTH-type transcriptional regulator BenM n=1 Tax=Antarctobacter heliothermus TaxID=74033 RepID=A0A222E340_9RHOB|nr:LysR family transcriptional regulator [Antarctobacter heliothermus]ASP20408.1 HTH-type transcriptional regulator BenM [Antarctobacter heliothermus]